MPERDKWRRYRSYLLRFWQEQGEPGDQASAWRFSIEDPHTGEQRAFAGLERLVAYLRSETGREAGQDEGGGP